MLVFLGEEGRDPTAGARAGSAPGSLHQFFARPDLSPSLTTAVAPPDGALRGLVTALLAVLHGYLEPVAG